jgi:hypothetical protein
MASRMSPVARRLDNAVYRRGQPKPSANPQAAVVSRDDSRGFRLARGKALEKTGGG